MATTTFKDCGGIVSKRAKACPRCGAPVKRKSSAGAGCLLLLQIAGGLVWVVTKVASVPRSSSGPTTQGTTQPVASSASPGKAKRMLGTGDVGILRSGDEHEDVLVGTTEEGNDRLTQLSVVRDARGVTQLVVSGRVLVVKDGTHAKLIDAGFVTHEVRIVDGPHAGRSGFIPAEFLVAE